MAADPPVARIKGKGVAVDQVARGHPCVRGDPAKRLVPAGKVMTRAFRSSRCRRSLPVGDPLCLEHLAIPVQKGHGVVLKSPFSVKNRILPDRQEVIHVIMRTALIRSCIPAGEAETGPQKTARVTPDARRITLFIDPRVGRRASRRSAVAMVADRIGFDGIRQADHRAWFPTRFHGDRLDGGIAEQGERPGVKCGCHPGRFTIGGVVDCGARCGRRQLHGMAVIDRS